MQSDELKCLVHNNGNIIGFCLNKQCKNSRPCCLKCQREFHSGHFNEIMDYDELEKLLEKNQQQMEQVLFYISELESVIQIIRISYQYLRQTSDLNRVQALHDKIDIVLKNDEAKFKQLFLDFKDLLKQIGMFAENIFDFKMDQYVIKENIDKLNEVRQLVKQNGCNKSLKVLENFVVSKKQQSSLTKIQSLIITLYQSLGVIEEKKQENKQNQMPVQLQYMQKLNYEIDILDSELYKMFDELILPVKRIYLQYFTENYEKAASQQKTRDFTNERQNNHSNQGNKEIQKMSTCVRPQSAAPKSYEMQPAERSLFQQVEEKTNLFRLPEENYNEQFTILYEDSRDKPKQLQQNSQSIFINQSYDNSANVIRLEKPPIRPSTIKFFQTQKRNQTDQNKEKKYKQLDEMWQIIKNQKKDIQSFDALFNGKNEIVMILSQFQMMNKYDEWQTVETFPFQREPQNSIKYNFTFGGGEIQILTNKYSLNSNIINAYTNYLMIEDEKVYFSKNKNDRSKYKRLFIFTSEFITDCALDSDLPHEQLQQKYLYLWLKYLHNFSKISYKFWLIYKQIGFVVNYKNQHWYFVQVIFQKKFIVIYDSIQKAESFYYYIKDLLQYLFQQITSDQNLDFQIKFAREFPQQQDGVSCGYYTCMAANYLSQRENQQFLQLEEMQRTLNNLFIASKL